MRTSEEMKIAREVVIKAMTTPGLSDQQKTAFAGMSVALQWVCKDGGHTLQALIENTPIAVGRTLPVPNFNSPLENN